MTFAARRPIDTRVLAERAVTTFSALWAFAALFHQAAYPDLAIGLSALLVTLPALCLLLRPASTSRLTIALVCQAVAVWRWGPAYVSNHWIFTFLVGNTILLVMAEQLLRDRTWRVDRAALFLRFAPIVRVELLILYFYAVLHKLNTSFLDPALSCAPDQYGEMAKAIPFLPTSAWVQYATIYGTLAVEAAIPVLLCIRRTRLIGVAIAVAFHLMLALNPEMVFFDFSSMLLAAYFLFIPYDYRGALFGGTGSPALARLRAAGRRVRRVVNVLTLAVAVALIGAYLLRSTPNTPGVINGIQEGVRVAFVLYTLGLVALVVAVARSTDVLAAVRGIDSLAPRGVVGVMMPVVVFLNGASPYLGLKTEASFSMFSNLRTEAGETNHLFVPTWLQVAPYQRDVVRIVHSSDRMLAGLARRDRRLTFTSLRRQAHLHPNASVAYERGGREYRFARMADDPALARPLSFAERKLLYFRNVYPPGAGTPCRH